MDGQLFEAITRLGHPKLLVVGDIMLDRYSWASADRISPEAPVLVLRRDNQEVRLGGAAAVAALARQLEAEVLLAGVVGDDAAGRTVLRLLDEVSVQRKAVLCNTGRQTTTKERLVALAEGHRPHQILRVDDESRTGISRRLQVQLFAAIEKELRNCDVVLVSDYGKGVCSPNLLAAIISLAAERGIPVIVDPARTSVYRRYRYAWAITPNIIEAEFALGCSIRTSAEALQAARTICNRYHINLAIVKLDKEGIALAGADGLEQFCATSPRKVADATGAGDTVLAVVGLAAAAELKPTAAARLANLAAGLQVERLGVEPILRGELLAAIAREGPRSPDVKLVDLDLLKHVVKSYRLSGRKIVLTNGCFDLLHVGHLRSLYGAAQLGDVLIVTVDDNESVEQLKGAQQPIIDQLHRAIMVASVECVDHVLLLSSNQLEFALELLRPDVLVKGGTYSKAEVRGAALVEAYGGKVTTVGQVRGVSTTQIIESIQVKAPKRKSRR